MIVLTPNEKKQLQITACKVRIGIIDHHLNPDRNAAALTISHPQMCSTCEVVLRLLLQGVSESDRGGSMLCLRQQ